MAPNIKLKLWYFFAYQINPKNLFLKALHRRIPGWRLVRLNSGTNDFRFGIAPQLKYSLMVGDEMFINDPIVDLDKPSDVWYSWRYDASKHDLPTNLKQLLAIWTKAVKAFDSLPKETNQKPCPVCTHPNYSSGSGIHNGQICLTCFGLGQIFPLGYQTKLGERFALGTIITITDGYLRNVKFNPHSLLAFINLFERFGGAGGIAYDIYQYLVKHLPQVVDQVFPDVVVLKSANHNPNVWAKCNELYLTSNGQTYYLKTGQKCDTPANLTFTTPSEDYPSHWFWTEQFNFLRHLCRIHLGLPPRN